MTVKICKDCKHYIYDGMKRRKHQCASPKTIGVDLVTGEKIYRSAYDLRTYQGICGSDSARYFEPKEANEPTDR